MNPLPGHAEGCNCCRGITALTPLELHNRPGLTAISYRIGTHAAFKRSMLARLAAYELPELSGLRTRKDEDFTIALLDAWATVADVLTFYQERIANEFYLRPASERLSIRQMARLIGYELSPGVAASTYLAFTMETTKGSPEKIELGPRTRVQSTPGPDEKPQTFETTEAIEARPRWNAIAPQTARTQEIKSGVTELYLQGVSTRLEPGDAVLLVGQERDQNPLSTKWEFRVLTDVEQHTDALDPERSHTVVKWDSALGATPPQVDVKLYALRQRAALFGHNAPDPALLNPTNNTDIGDLISGDQWEGFFPEDDYLDLDVVYPKITVGSWLVADTLAYGGDRKKLLYKADDVESISLSKFALSSKVTRITPDRSLFLFSLRQTTVFAQSEQLRFAKMPIREPLYGDTLRLSEIVAGLQPRQRLAISGKLQRLKIDESASGLSIETQSGVLIALAPGDELRLSAPPVKIVSGEAHKIDPEDLVDVFEGNTAVALRWEVLDRDGRAGRLTANSNQVRLIPAREDDEIVHEIARIKAEEDAVSEDRDRTTLTLEASLKYAFDLKSVIINANVALATQGETVTEEVLGSGDARVPHQKFTLRQSPLTHVSASNASGSEAELEVRVNDILWKEVPSLFTSGANERVYEIVSQENGKTRVQFGDGTNGARLPSGQNNVRAVYRKGIGLAGMVKAGQLDQLMTRPLGLKEVQNPLPADGAAAPEERSEARQNAPLTVLTLDRVVSLRDYEDFARAYAGVEKAHASWVWQGSARVILVTVAGPKGAAIVEGSNLFNNLVDALRDAGDPEVHFRVLTYRQATFRLSGTLIKHEDYLADKVKKAMELALKEAFSFEKRAFGQPVARSEVISVIQAVPGVLAVDLDHFYRSDAAVDLEHRLTAQPPGMDTSGDFQAAELLTLAASSLVDLEVST